MNIINVGYDSTNYYIVADASPKLLIDVGWPGTLAKLRAQCKRTGIHLAHLKYFLVTHYHPDHAGLAGELKRTGIKLIVLESQLAAIPLLKTFMKPQNNYIDIVLRDNVMLKLDESRAFLAGLGIAGEIISSPGHSDDSITVILDEGAAFTGDLPHPVMLTEDNQERILASWEKIGGLGVKRLYPGHGPARYMDFSILPGV